MTETTATTTLTEPVAKPERIYPAKHFEADSDMPEDYRALVLRLIIQTGELITHPGFEQMVAPIRDLEEKAPTPADRVRMAAFYADELRHGFLFDGLARQLGYDPSAQQDELRGIEGVELLRQCTTWAQGAVYNMLFDRAGFMQVNDYETSSYAPLARTGMTVAIDERGHAQMGHHHLREVCRRPEGREDAQQALTWMWPKALDMYGTSTGHRQYEFIRYGLKTKTNEEARQDYITTVTPLLNDLGLQTPNPTQNRRFL